MIEFDPKSIKDPTSEISDNEIRIITNADKPRPRYRRRAWIWILGVILAIAIILIVALIVRRAHDSDTTAQSTRLNEWAKVLNDYDEAELLEKKPKPFVLRIDTMVNGADLSLFAPHNATPTLAIGNQVLTDTTIVLLAQAADVRGDNGQIVGTFVEKGELKSKGESKSGFCSISNGQITLGVADATPMLEQVLSTNGYFFRQYPLVAASEVIENKPKGKAIRKAMAEIGGRIYVASSNNPLTYSEFSQALADLGATNAIALVGGQSLMRYKDPQGHAVDLGRKWNEDFQYVNYIVWR